MYRLSVVGEYLRMAWAALRTHKLRSILTTLGIFIGVATIITIFTTIQGLNEYVIGQFSNIGAKTMYVQKWPWVQTGDWWKFRNRREITYKEYEALLKNAKEPDYVAPSLFSFKTVKYQDETYERVMVFGTTDQYKDTDNINPAQGRFLTSLDVHRNHKVAVLGHELAQNLFKDDSPLGKRIKIGTDKYTVVGVNEKTGSFFGQSMDNLALVPIGTFQRVYGSHRGLTISIAVTDVSRLDDMKEEARGILRRSRKLSPADEDDFAINQRDQLTEMYRNLTSTLYAIIFVIGAVSLIVGGIGITNIMLVSVTERTKEIGIRKAIGARRSNILAQFLIESIAISSIGGILGIIVGYMGGNLVLSQMELATGVTAGSIMIGYGFSTFVGVVAGFYPAWKAARMNPIDALHFE